jgi:hypothetical protein
VYRKTKEALDGFEGAPRAGIKERQRIGRISSEFMVYRSLATTNDLRNGWHWLESLVGIGCRTNAKASILVANLVSVRSNHLVSAEHVDDVLVPTNQLCNDGFDTSFVDPGCLGIDFWWASSGFCLS